MRNFQREAIRAEIEQIAQGEAKEAEGFVMAKAELESAEVIDLKGEPLSESKLTRLTKADLTAMLTKAELIEAVKAKTVVEA